MAVRNESVRLSLDDAGFTTGMAKAAAATALLDKQLDSLDGNNVRASSGIKGTTRDVDDLGNAFRRNEAKIDKFSGRLRLAADAVAMLGPGLVPIATIGVPAIAGLASQLGIVTLGAGATLLAFQGVGDALGALNKAQLDPTTANLARAQLAMDRLGPSAQAFVEQLQAMRPAFAAVRDAGADTLFPRLALAFEDLEVVLPKAERLMSTFGRAVGEVAEMTAESLASGEWNSFINFLNREAEPTLVQLGHTVGSLAHGLAEMWMAFDPLNDDFGSWLQDAAAGFDDWAAGLSETEGFQEFVAYIRETGPQVADTFKAIANAVLQIAEAAAPLGGPVLHALEGIANVIAKVADSNLGTPLLVALSTFSALNTASALWGRVLESSGRRAESGIGRVTNALGRAVTAAAALAAAGAIMDALDKAAAGAAPNIERLTAALIAADNVAFAEEFGGDIKSALDELDPGVVENFAGALDDLGEKGGFVGTAVARGIGGIVGLGDDMVVAGVQSEKLGQAFESLDSALAGLVASGGADRAKAAFDALAASQGLSAEETAFLLSQLPEYGSALQGVANDATLAAEGNEAVARSTSGLASLLGGTADAAHDTADGYSDAASAAQEFQSALEGLSGFLDQKEALLGYERALTQLNQGLRNGFTRQDRDNLYAYGRAIEQVANTIKGAGKRDEFLQAPLKALRAMSQEAGPKAKAEIDDLIQRLSRLDKAKAEPELDADEKPAKKKISATDELLRALVGKKWRATLDAETQAALDDINGVQNALNNLRDKTVFVHIQRTGSTIDSGGVAGGGTIPGQRTPYGDKALYMLAPGEEVISNRYGQADKWRPFLKMINASHAANGATVGLANGGTTRSPDSMLEILNIIAGIRDLRRQLAADGKDKLEGIKRRIAELQLEVAQKELRLAKHAEEREARQEAREKAKETRANLRGIASGFSTDSLVGAPDLTIAQQAAAMVADLRRQIKEAGGEWTKSLTRWSKGLVAAASALDDVNAQIVAETAKRDRLVDALADQQAKLDQLKSTMEAFASSVAGNFLSNPFNQTISGGGTPSQALLDAQAQLAAIRNSPTGDSVASAALASSLIAAIKKLQVGGTDITGVKAFESTLDSDIANLTKFEDAISKLTGSLGLDSQGGLFQSLLASGDVNTATGLAGMTPEQIDALEAKFALRAEKAAAFAAQQTQVVFGPQFAAETAAAAALQGLVDQSNRHLASLVATQQSMEERIRRMDQGVADKLEPQFTKVTDAQKETTRATKQVGKDAAEHLRWAFN